MVAKEGRDLRVVNLLGAFAIAKILIAIVDRLHPAQTEASKEESVVLEFRKRHTVANIMFFPVLFFFYGLYYTDVLSTLAVLVTYLFHLKRQPFWTLIAGLVSLWFRQTNVFWVGTYLGVLELRRSLPVPGAPNKSKISKTSNFDRVLHDPLIADASLNG